jgi:hypothetical protein
MFDDGEIIKVSATSISAVGNQLSIYDPDTDGSVNRYNSFQIACSTVTRGHLSTTAAAHYPGDLVYDVTIPVILSELILDRFEAGAPIIQVETGLQKYKYQVGDFITLDETLLVGLGFDGVDNTIKWEIISKDVDLSGTPPRINWTLCRVAPASTTSSTVEVIDKAPIDWADISLGPIHDDIDDGIVFVDAGTQQVDKANFVYDSTNIRVGVGTDTPETLIHAKVGDSGTSPNSGTAIFAETDSTSASVPIMQVTSAGDTAAFQVMSDGKAGFGTASPGEKVEVDGSVFLSNLGDALKLKGSYSDSYARVLSATLDLGYMTSNAYFDGAIWSRDNDSRRSSLIVTVTTSTVSMQTLKASAAAGAISWTTTSAIDNDGKFVIGNTTNALAHLHVRPSSSGVTPPANTSMFVESSSTSSSVPLAQFSGGSDANVMNIMADGLVGIGSGSPSERLEVAGKVFTNDTRSGLKAKGTFSGSFARFTSEFQDSAYMATNAYFTGSTWQRDDTGKGSTLVTNGYEALNTWQTYYANSGAGAISLIPTAATDRSGNRVFGQSTLPLAKVHIRESSSGVTPAASTGLFVESSSSSSSVALIHCSSVGANHTLNCYADGKIGMGTNTPGARLHVQASSSGVTPAANTVLFLESSSTSSTVALMHCSGGTVDHAMNLYADGKLGLGTNTPGARLHVKPSSSGATIPANTVLAVESSSTSASVPLAQFSGGSVDNAMNIMADGKVGVGSGSPDVQFHIQASAVTSASANSNTVLMVEKAGSDAWISIHTDTDRSGIIGFGDTSWEGAIVYTHSADQMDFYTTQSVAVRIDSAQRLMIQDSSATPTTVSGFVHIYSKNDSKLYAAFGGSGKADQLIVDGS